jgi:transketolase
MKNKHDSMRGWFAYELYQHMKKNKDIILIVGDLGYKVFDKHREDFPDQFINTGAAEQAMMGIAVGLALMGKIPVVYSITNFLLYRPFETIRNYINHERISVKLIGSGRDKDYEHDGISHWSEDAYKLFTGTHQDGIFNNITDLWPETKEEIPELLTKVLETKKPYFVSLRR